jgi:CxxC motif-containing protein (DUF1111 family)
MNRRSSASLGRISLLVLTLCVIATLIVNSTARHSRVLAQSTEGAPLSGLTTGQLSLFNVGFLQFNVKWDPDHGLGPIYTNTDCSNCHTAPTSGGSNNSMRTTFFGALNSDGSFNPLTNEGGFILQPLSISHFVQACVVVPEIIPADATLMSQRVPPDLFGAGLVDAIPDSTIIAFAGDKGMGINGMVNTVNDWNGVPRPGRFGTKAQFASLLQTVGTAFSHDIGVTNPVNPNEDCPNAPPGTPQCPTKLVSKACLKVREPNDPGGKLTIQIFDYPSLLAPNPPSSDTAGMALFVSTGCALCHNPQYTTKANVKLPTNFTGGTTAVINALSKQPVNLYSDLLIHHMGPGLADCMEFGQAQGDQWRTTALWGLSTRTVYLHDGRTTDLPTAIQLHHSFAGQGTACSNTYPDSEANAVIDAFNALSPDDQATLITFLNTL